MLCALCEAFDVEALYSRAAERLAVPVTNTANAPARLAGFHDPLKFAEHEGFPDFYKHQPNIYALRKSAEDGCRLCSLIWETFAEYLVEDLPDRPLDDVLAHFEVGWSVDEKQLYLGLSSWLPELTGFPNVTAVQLVQMTPSEPRQSRTIARFDACVPCGRSWGRYERLWARELPLDPRQSLLTAAAWLQNCLDEHTVCNGRTTVTLPPTRLIHVGGPEADPRIVQSTGREKWAALSYCWGGDSSFVLKKANSEKWMKAIPFADFPATLKDAIIITRTLGLQYLWIDALCIVQDSAEDWAAEAARMGDVYRGAILTISGTESADTGSGLLHERVPISKRCELALRRSGTIDTITLQPIQPLWGQSQTVSILDSRGWTLQEAMLSLRNLQFGKRNIAWECSELRIDESGRPLATPFGWKHSDGGFTQSLLISSGSWSTWLMSKAFSTSLARYVYQSRPGYRGEYSYGQYQELSDRWLDIVREYITRDLTYHTDILPALSGLAAAFQPLVGSQYHAGIWRKEMIRGLTWVVNLSADLVDEARLLCKEPGPYYAPSWSWASIPARNIFFTRQKRDSEMSQEAVILDCHTTTIMGKPYGEVSDGYIVIRALMFDILDLRQPYARHKSTMPFLERRIRDDILVATDGLNEYDYQHRDCEGQHFAVLQLCRWVRKGGRNTRGVDFMVVESTGEATFEYRRIGLKVFSDLDEPEGAAQAVWKELNGPAGRVRTIRIV